MKVRRSSWSQILVSALLVVSVASHSMGQVRGSNPSRGSYVRTGVARAAFEYAELVVRISRAKKVDPAFVLAVMTVESKGDPNAVSRSGAKGLMQLMPATCLDHGVTDPFDPEQNIQGGVSVLARHLKKYGGDLEKTLAAYNAGPRTVADGSWKKRAETRAYVPKVLEIYSALKQAPEWMAGISIENEPPVDSVPPMSQTPDQGSSTPPIGGDPVPSTPPTEVVPVVPVVAPAPAPKKNYPADMMRTVAERQKMTEYDPVSENPILNNIAQKLSEAEAAEPMIGYRQLDFVEKQLRESTFGRGRVTLKVLKSLSDKDFATMWAREPRLKGNQLGTGYAKDALGQSVWVVILVAR